MRRHLGSLEQECEERLRHLGGLALEMHRRDQLDPDLLMSRAGDISVLEKEMGLLQVGLEQGKTIKELQRIARGGGPLAS